MNSIIPIAEAGAISLTVCPCFLIDALISAGADTALHEGENEVEALIGFLLALNDDEGIGGTARPMGSFFRIPEDEQQRLVSLHFNSFIQAADICDLDPE